MFSQPERVLSQARNLMKRAGMGALCWALSACSEGAPAQKPQAPSAPKYDLERPVEGLPAPAPRDDTFRRGVSIELFVGEVEEPERGQYREWLEQAAQLGVRDLELVVQWSQVEAAALELAPHAITTVDDEFLSWLMDQAHARNLRVVLTPVIDIEQVPAGSPHRPIAPTDAKRWFWSYHRVALHYARIAEAHKAVGYAVGADLPEALASEPGWASLIKDVRKAFKGKLTYAARSEHFDRLSMWEALDFVTLVGASGDVVSRLHGCAKLGKPCVLSGLGGPTARVQSDKAGLKQALDQLRAMYQSLHAERALSGLYVSVARPGAGKSGERAPLSLAAAPAQVLRHWYTRSRAALPN